MDKGEDHLTLFWKPWDAFWRVYYFGEMQTSESGDYQNSGPFLGTLIIRCRIIIGIQKGTIILTTTQVRCKKNKRVKVSGHKYALGGFPIITGTFLGVLI